MNLFDLRFIGELCELLYFHVSLLSSNFKFYIMHTFFSLEMPSEVCQRSESNEGNAR